MSAMRGLIVTTFFTMGLMSAAQSQEGVAPVTAVATTPAAVPVPVKRAVLFRPHVAAHAKPHDAAKPVTHLVRMEGREAASPAVRRAAAVGSPERVATLIGRASCDSLLCPGYAMIGVGF